MIYPLVYYLVIGAAIVFGIWRIARRGAPGCQWKIAVLFWVAVFLIVADWAIKITQWLVRPLFAELVMVGLTLGVFVTVMFLVWQTIWFVTRRFNRWFDKDAGRHI